jgi:hypothetical protein
MAISKLNIAAGNGRDDQRPITPPAGPGPPGSASTSPCGFNANRTCLSRMKELFQSGSEGRAAQ